MSTADSNLEARAKRMAELAPDVFPFVDESGEVLPQGGELRLDASSKLMFARMAIKRHQSFDDVVGQSVRRALRTMARTGERSVELIGAAD